MLDYFAQSQLKWNFAILDIDCDDELTTLLKISKTPTVLLIDDGDVVDGIKGLANDRELELFFQSLQKIVNLKSHKQS